MKNKKKWIAYTVIIVLITNFLTLYGSNILSLAMPNGRVMISRNEYNDIMKFQKMFIIRDRLYKYYDGKIEDDKLVEGAIKGLTDSLNDPYTVFMNEKEYKDFNTQTEGNYYGVGLQVGVQGNDIVVISTFENSPARKAGILSKDILKKVNGKTVTGKDLEQAVAMMKDETSNNDVKLSLYRKDKGDFNVSLNRDKIEMITVKSEMLSNNIGYIQVYMFDENTDVKFLQALKNLKSKGMNKLIVDLRGNPGGLLNVCQNMVSNFVEKNKVIVSTIDKYKRKSEYKSKGGDFVGMPLVVLIDEGTASASEIFSGAVRDYKLGTLVGKKSYGKGVVQTILDTKDGTALKVTISKYYTPSGENINKKGIKPDVEVEYPNELKLKKYNRNADPQFNKALEMAKEIK